jgi:hypothetical protein
LGLHSDVSPSGQRHSDATPKDTIMKPSMSKLVLSAALGAGTLTGAALVIPAISQAQTATTTAPSATSTAPSAAEQSANAKAKLASVLAPLVADGTLTQAQADKVVAALEAARPEGGRGDRGGHGRRFALDTAATAIGITADELRTELQAGKSIAAVATAKGVDVQKVIDAMVAEYTTREQAEVATGEHTQAEVDAKVAQFKTRAAEIVNSIDLGDRGRGGRGGRGGHD